MRTTRSGRSASISASALVALVLSVLGGPVSAGPLECVDPCEIAAVESVYLLPVTQIASGTQVTWTTSQSSHPTANSTSNAQQCFNVAVGSNVIPVPVQFDIADGRVLATESPGGGAPLPCPNALPLPTGAFLLPYRCLLHVEMHGLLVIEP